MDDFEVGVFNGQYVTGVPEGYFEHLSCLRAGKKRKANAAGLTTVDLSEPSDSAVVVTNGGPVNDAGPEHREDIRFVLAGNMSRGLANVLTLFFSSIHNFASEIQNSDR